MSYATTSLLLVLLNPLLVLNIVTTAAAAVFILTFIIKEDNIICLSIKSTIVRVLRLGVNNRRRNGRQVVGSTPSSHCRGTVARRCRRAARPRRACTRGGAGTDSFDATLATPRPRGHNAPLSCTAAATYICKRAGSPPQYLASSSLALYNDKL